MKNARSLNTERAGLRGFGHWTTVILALALGFFFNIATAFAQATPPAAATPTDDEPDPCKGVVFSSTENEELGCSVAAALHFGGTSLEGVRTYVGKYSAGRRGTKWLKKFNKDLRQLTKDVFYASFSHIFSKDTVGGWTDEKLIEEPAVAATRLDVMHQTRRTDNKVRALQKAIKEVAPAPPPPSKKAPPKELPPPVPHQRVP